MNTAVGLLGVDGKGTNRYSVLYTSQSRAETHIREKPFWGSTEDRPGYQLSLKSTPLRNFHSGFTGIEF